jgi:hypothetical protein
MLTILYIVGSHELKNNELERLRGPCDRGVLLANRLLYFDQRSWRCHAEVAVAELDAF